MDYSELKLKNRTLGVIDTALATAKYRQKE